jgi:E3 ubiquitin-protein ligase HUWE1
MECNSLDFVAAISRNRPDTAETIIDVMERQLSGRGGIQDVLLPRLMRDGASDRASRSGSASSQRASTSEADDKKDAESVKESDKLKKEAASLNDPLADLLNLSELWQILSESLGNKKSQKFSLTKISGELDVNKDSQTFMVLQPAVEAFFMVHASASEKESEKKETKQEMLSHIEQIAPLPETHSDEKEDESSSEQNKFKNMPQNTIKFLQFAEKHKVFKISFISVFTLFRLY